MAHIDAFNSRLPSNSPFISIQKPQQVLGFSLDDRRRLVSMQRNRRVFMVVVFFISASLYATQPIVFKINPTAQTNTNTVCLSELVDTTSLPAQVVEKLSRYCKIETKSKTARVTAKDVELHAWAAGVIPDKIIGEGVTIEKSNAVIEQKPFVPNTHTKLRRGTSVRLVLNSPYIKIEREAHLLQDAALGETVDVRPQGTRKTLRARLVDSLRAELIP
ncbi:MAG: hypothetical protein LDLANPLL_01533 [Turneriella sp.]|nr:hypothetical protein [Turneriella sp.]